MRKQMIKYIGPSLIGFGALIVLFVVGQFTLIFGARAFEDYLLANSPVHSIIPTDAF